MRVLAANRVANVRTSCNVDRLVCPTLDDVTRSAAGDTGT